MNLPIENFRDILNIDRQDIKYKYMPGRLYYKYRAKKYAKNKTPELNLIRYLADNNKISLDIGANLGLFTYFMSKHSKKVLAFEPNPYPLRYLPRLIDKNVEILKIAIGNSNKKMNLLIPKSNKGWSSNGATLKDIEVKNGIKIEVDCKKIDSFNFSNVGFIKIDVEGAEADVLLGSQNTIKHNKPNLMIENEIVHQNNTDYIFQIVKEMGYTFYYFDDTKLKKLSDKIFLSDIQKNPENKVIGYVQNFIAIHDENIGKFEKIILK